MSGPKPKCLACQNELGIFRSLAHRRFCCDEHEQRYLAELQKIAAARLRSARLAMTPPSTSLELPRNDAEGGDCAVLISLPAHVQA
jgi:hypothetical protein